MWKTLSKTCENVVQMLWGCCANLQGCCAEPVGKLSRTEAVGREQIEDGLVDDLSECQEKPTGRRDDSVGLDW
jgi:hypothetical protein